MYIVYETDLRTTAYTTKLLGLRKMFLSLHYPITCTVIGFATGFVTKTLRVICPVIENVSYNN